MFSSTGSRKHSESESMRKMKILFDIVQKLPPATEKSHIFMDQRATARKLWRK